MTIQAGHLYLTRNGQIALVEGMVESSVLEYNFWWRGRIGSLKVIWSAGGFHVQKEYDLMVELCGV